MIKIYNQGIKLKIKSIEDKEVDINTRISEKQLKEILEILYPKIDL